MPSRPIDGKGLFEDELMPVVNKTRAQFLVLPLPSWRPIAPWPIPFTAGHLQQALDELEEFVLSKTVWQSLKNMFLAMPLSVFTSAAVMANAIEEWCKANEQTAWAVTEPE
jgi:hypothetical protein